MNKELSNLEYAAAIRFRLKTTGIFIITSCNLTSSEMDNIFVGEKLLKRREEISGYKSFTFGGVKG